MSVLLVSMLLFVSILRMQRNEIYFNGETRFFVRYAPKTIAGEHAFAGRGRCTTCLTYLPWKYLHVLDKIS